MCKMLIIALAAAVAGCGGDGSRRGQEPDPKTQALAGRHKDISREFVEKLAARIEREYPPTGHDAWTLINDVLAHADTSSEEILEQRVIQVVLKALRVRAENIFAAVFVGRDPPGTDDLKFMVINRTGRDVASVNGVIQVRGSFGATVETLKLNIDKPIPAGGELACGGHWSIPSGLIEQLAETDSKYELKYVASKVTYADSSVEQFP